MKSAHEGEGEGVREEVHFIQKSYNNLNLNKVICLEHISIENLSFVDYL